MKRSLTKTPLTLALTAGLMLTASWHPQPAGAAAPPTETPTFTKPAVCDDQGALLEATQCPAKGDSVTGPIVGFLCQRDCSALSTAVEKVKVGRRGLPEPEVLFSAEGLCLMQSGKFSEGRSRLEESLNYRRANSDSLTALGLAACKAGNLPLAEQLLWEATWFDRFRLVKLSFAQQVLGEVLIAQHKGDAALELFRQAAAGDSKAIGPKLSLAKLALSAGKRADAIAAARSALEAAPQNAEASLTLTEALLAGANRQADKESLGEARTRAQETVNMLGAKDPRRSKALLLLARAFTETGDFTQAEQTLKAIPPQAPEAAQAQALLAQLDVERKATLDVVEANRVQ